MSGEHEVSCVSAGFIEKTLKETDLTPVPVYIDRKGQWHHQAAVATTATDNRHSPCSLQFIENKHQLLTETGEIEVDFVFPIIHGSTGEDGQLQGFLEFLRIPYAGCGVLASAICMDKSFTRSVFKEHNIPQVKYHRIDQHQWEADRTSVLKKVAQNYSFPCFIKPANMGSSVGVSKVDGQQQLESAIEEAFRYDDHILCEEGVDAREVEIAITGNYPSYETSITGEITPNHKFYSYEAKYLDANGATLAIPANISPELQSKVSEIAKKAFSAVNGDGFARIDFFIDRKSGELYLNEINTLPGFTPISMFPMLWDRSGTPAPQLIKRIIALGVERFNAHNKKLILSDQ